MYKNLLIFLLIGVIGMMGCAGRFKYEIYSSQDPELNITLEYPSDWLTKEQKGSDYAQVIFSEPKREDKIFKAAIVVAVKDSAGDSIETIAVQLLQKRVQFKDAKVLSKSKRRILHTKAYELLFSYKTLEQIISRAESRLIPVKERIVLFTKDNKCYIVRYQNTAKEFAKFNRACSHALKTLKIVK